MLSFLIELVIENFLLLFDLFDFTLFSFDLIGQFFYVVEETCDSLFGVICRFGEL